MFAQVLAESPVRSPEPIAGVSLRRLGRHTCVVTPAADFLRHGAAPVEEAVRRAVDRGCDDFVFDLTAVRRWDTRGLRRLGDLWGRLALLGCEIFVAADEPGLRTGLARLPARTAWTVSASPAQALEALLARPV